MHVSCTPDCIWDKEWDDRGFPSRPAVAGPQCSLLILRVLTVPQQLFHMGMSADCQVTAGLEETDSGREGQPWLYSIQGDQCRTPKNMEKIHNWATYSSSVGGLMQSEQWHSENHRVQRIRLLKRGEWKVRSCLLILFLIKQLPLLLLL